MLRPPELAVRWVLCDADGTLFPSEEPAFEASAAVVNAVLDAHGVPGDLTGDELRRVASGRNFRSLVRALLESSGQRIEEDELARWAERENAVVTQRLITCLRPDPSVDRALGRLGDVFELALVSSSSLGRLAGCLEATGLAHVFPEQRRFSAADSLPAPSSKPDPAVYLHAVATLGIEPAGAVAVEDASAGVASAVAAGVPVIGLTANVSPDEAQARRRDLLAAGARTVAPTWDDLADLLAPAGSRVPA